MIALIVVSTVCFVLESEADVETGILYHESGTSLDALQMVELVSVIIFTTEYVLRFCCCPCGGCGAIWFVLDPCNIIDLLAILPFWLSLALGGGSGLSFIRVIRLVRIFRVFKTSKYSFGLAMFSGALRASIDPLSILLFTLCLAVIILSSIMCMIEGDVANPNATGYDPELLLAAGVTAELQLYCFGTIPRAFWWSVVTMATVGFGDCYPVSLVGKIVCMFTMLSGVLILALPITVVGSNFNKMVEIHQEDTSLYGDTDADADGTVDEAELRDFLELKNREGVLRKDIPLAPLQLLKEFDKDGNQRLSFTEFQQLKDYVIDPSTTDLPKNVRILMKRSERSDVDVKALHVRLGCLERMLATALGPRAAADALEETGVKPAKGTRPPSENDVKGIS